MAKPMSVVAEGCRHLRADARRALRHDGIEEAGDIDTAGVERRGHILRPSCVVQHHRDDRGLAGEQFEAGLGERGAEALGVGGEQCPAIVGRSAISIAFSEPAAIGGARLLEKR